IVNSGHRRAAPRSSDEARISASLSWLAALDPCAPYLHAHFEGGRRNARNQGGRGHGGGQEPERGEEVLRRYARPEARRLAGARTTGVPGRKVPTARVRVEVRWNQPGDRRHLGCRTRRGESRAGAEGEGSGFRALRLARDDPEG